jgi:dTDP-4-dehydrorhamnose 3,5-epimerase
MPMPVTFKPTEIASVLEVHTGVIADDRGFFSESYSQEMWHRAGFDEVFLQDNLSKSRRGTLRGMHYQIEPHAMGKLVRCLQGAIFDVAVDLRAGSPTYSRWVGRELSAENHLSLWVPKGFAHGFLALEDETLVHYKCTAIHTPESERAVSYKDPTIAIEWPIAPTVTTEKDEQAPLLEEAEFDFDYRG